MKWQIQYIFDNRKRLYFKSNRFTVHVGPGEDQLIIRYHKKTPMQEFSINVLEGKVWQFNCCFNDTGVRDHHLGNLEEFVGFLYQSMRLRKAKS